MAISILYYKNAKFENMRADYARTRSSTFWKRAIH